MHLNFHGHRGQEHVLRARAPFDDKVGKQGIHRPVSHDHSAGSDLELIEHTFFYYF